MTDLDALRREELTEYVRSHLPPPVREEQGLDGSTCLCGGDPGEVVVRVTVRTVSVAVFAVRWEGPHTPVVRPRRLASFRWDRIPSGRMLMSLHVLIEAAAELRRASFRTCSHCGKTQPPEWMHGEDVFQSCAVRDLGVVY